MNRFAYRTTGLAIKTLSMLSKARIHLHDEANIPQGSLIFVINHFTRMETLFLPYHLFYLTGKKPVWSLGDASLFKGAMGDFLNAVGVVSTRNPDRDQLIVRSLLTGDASWIIYPEGLMVKNKKLIEKGRFMLSYAGGKHPPHTGAATLALRTEFYRQRLIALSETRPDEAARLMALFQIEDIHPLKTSSTYIVPVNITYFPIRARENALSYLAERIVDDLPDRMMEEIMTEGTMLLSGVDIDVRFGKAIAVKDWLTDAAVTKDISDAHSFDFDDPIASKRIMHQRALTIMQRYMCAIYSMTTVNSDHLFASMIKQIPCNHVNAMNLRRRVYLTAARNLASSGSWTHKSLSEDQIHLITDDSFHRFADFIHIAIGKRVLAQDADDLIKQPAMFSGALDFHRVRIENPLAVMANEVEPLTQLERSIRWLAWQPGFWIRRQLFRHLFEKALMDFDQDYHNFHIEGESKDKSVGTPIFIRGRSGRPGIVLLHGYMAAPAELKGLAEYLAKHGWWVYVPRLKGHGTSPEDLAIRTYRDWMTSVDEGFALLHSRCRHVILGGFSMGAGLALEAAARIQLPSLCGVFGVCPPFELLDYTSRLAPAVNMWNRLMKSVKHDGNSKEFVENHPENPHINYLRNPVSGVQELEKLMKLTENRLKEVHLPTLLVQADEDPVVDEKGTRKAFKLLKSERKQCMMFHAAHHGILNGANAPEVYQVIADFVSHCRRS